MKGLMTKPFPYFVGIYSLEELVTRDSRVCVINILGNESRKVTPVSHSYSGGNVVAGVQYGRLGRLETDKGDIPVFRSVLDVMKNQIPFDIGVIYLPPAAVSQAVWELVTYNKALKRIIIITEKVPTRDSRNIRFTCQEAGVDVIGANCLGVANVWDHVRVGGALGGDNPEEALIKGSVALHSNSGNFTTTISEYLKTGGFGISTAVSSGKDVYIHFALAEFLYAAQNDPRTKAVALYVEPGGYYEKQALEWIKSRRFGFNKPIVVCVTGRWKKDILRSCGHAGAMAGSGDDAESKERWFDEYFNCDVFDPKNPVVSKKGIRISSIQHFPEAMRAIYKKIDETPDFKSTGDLTLKLWISDNILKLPADIDIPITRAMSPYGEQIEEITKHVGATYLNQNMRNKSGASRINPKTLVAELHGTPVLDLSTQTVEQNVFFALAKVQPENKDLRKVNFLLNMFLKIGGEEIGQIDAAKSRNCTPNAYLGAQIAMLGNTPLIQSVRENVIWIIDTLREFGWYGEIPAALRKKIIRDRLTGKEEPETDFTSYCFKEVGFATKRRPPLQFCQQVLEIASAEKKFLKDRDAYLLASIVSCLFWNPMLGKRISRQDVEDAVVYFYIIARLVAYSVIDPNRNNMWKKLAFGKELHPTTSFTENVFKILLNRKPTEIELTELQMLLGLTITNGPGTISAKGAKESVSARNHITLAFTGFLCNTGLAHGGNGFEAVDYLMQQFKKADLGDPGDLNSNINLTSLANKAAKAYRTYKTEQKEMGHMNYMRIPCINHPVFKGNQVNIDPREDYIKKQLEKMGIRNIFLDFYHELVKELHNEGVTDNVFCVNVDAVLAVITLKLIWQDLKARRISMHQAQDLVFILFLIGRAIGVAAEIADHRNRGQDMDCRTPQSELTFVL